jgi:SPP1 family predicted phage head-tail adaptor
VKMLDEITLIAKTRSQDSGGYTTETTVSTTVYAEIRSVGYREYYAAQADTMRAEIVFLINPDEYGGQAQVTYGSKSYRVIRTFTPPRGYTELHCARG